MPWIANVEETHAEQFTPDENTVMKAALGITPLGADQCAAALHDYYIETGCPTCPKCGITLEENK